MITTETRAKELGASISFEYKGIVASGFPTYRHRDAFCLYLAEYGYCYEVSFLRGNYTVTYWAGLPLLSPVVVSLAKYREEHNNVTP